MNLETRNRLAKFVHLNEYDSFRTLKEDVDTIFNAYHDLEMIIKRLECEMKGINDANREYPPTPAEREELSKNDPLNFPVKMQVIPPAESKHIASLDSCIIDEWAEICRLIKEETKP